MATGGRARGVSRVVDILDHLAKTGRPAVINELAERVGAPKSSVYDLVQLMLARSLLETVDAQGRVFLGSKLHMYASVYRQRFPLLEVARPLVAKLAQDTGEIAELCAIVDGKLGILDSASGSRPYWWSSPAGTTYPLPLSSAGQLLCAHLSAAEIAALIPPEDFANHQGGSLGVEDFVALCRQARARGHAEVDGLLDRHVAAVSAPLLESGGIVTHVVGLSFPVGELQRQRESLLSLLQQACHDIRERLPRA